VQIRKNREELISEYYRDYYDKLQHSGIQGFGQRLMNTRLEKYWINTKPAITLELGFGSGQHLDSVLDWPKEIYVGLDSRVSTLNTKIPDAVKLAVIEGDIHFLPFPDRSIERILMTCLLHHLDNPYSALCEISRILDKNGEVAILMPTDPGFFNRFIKKFTVHRKAKRFENYNSRLIYALDHRNHIDALISIIKYVFEDDKIKIKYGPFSYIKSWNLNLFVIVSIKRG